MRRLKWIDWQVKIKIVNQWSPEPWPNVFEYLCNTSTASKCYYDIREPLAIKEQKPPCILLTFLRQSRIKTCVDKMRSARFCFLVNLKCNREFRLLLSFEKVRCFSLRFSLKDNEHLCNSHAVWMVVGGGGPNHKVLSFKSCERWFDVDASYICSFNLCL